MFPITNSKIAIVAAILACAWNLSSFAKEPQSPLPVPEASPAATGSSPLFAEPPTLSAPATSNDRPTPSENVTINLINRLVQRGALTKEDAAELIRQAEQDAVVARAQAQAEAQAAVAKVALASAPPPPSSDAVRVTYVPEVVKRQIRDQLRQEVLQQARDENWAAPRTLPGWVTRFILFGDIRTRYEGDYYPTGNDNTGAFPNFNAINTGAPFDVTGSQFSPQYNVDQTRQRARLRVRVGAEVDLGDNFTVGLRIGSGESNTPVSGNQSLGLANQGQGGNFSKYAIWLDRGFLKYQLTGQLNKDVSIAVGRFDNPFYSASTILWADDLGFDGLAVKANYQVADGVVPFLTAGIFPIFNTDLNFASNQPAKFRSDDKWLYGFQLGTKWKITKDISANLAAAYYYYQNIQGKLSSPFVPLTAQDAGNTDDSRPSFAQKGNTYRALRNILPVAANNFGTINQFQYFGLASQFQQIALNGAVSYTRYEPFQATLFGEYINNVAWDRAAINAVAVNNRGPVTAGGTAPYVGGNAAWIVGLKVGNAALDKRWNWNASLSYRHVESDSVVDGFTDSDFGGGGTNLKGFSLAGAVALSPRVWLGVRWLSANSIAGPTYKNDIFQFDINAKF